MEDGTLQVAHVAMRPAVSREILYLLHSKLLRREATSEPKERGGTEILPRGLQNSDGGFKIYTPPPLNNAFWPNCGGGGGGGTQLLPWNLQSFESCTQCSKQSLGQIFYTTNWECLYSSCLFHRARVQALHSTNVSDRQSEKRWRGGLVQGSSQSQQPWEPEKCQCWHITSAILVAIVLQHSFVGHRTIYHTMCCKMVSHRCACGLSAKGGNRIILS